MNGETNSLCGRADDVRDYAFDETAPAQRAEIEKHIAGCEDCGLELDRLRLTTAALRVIPDREIPQRIAFVADAPPARSGWLAAFWSSGTRLGFASACVLAAGLVIFAYRPVPASPVAQTGMVPAAEVTKQINEAVAKAMVQVRAEVRAEDAQTLKVAIENNEEKHATERQAMAVAMENLAFLQKRMEAQSTYAMLNSSERVGGQ